MIDQLKLTLLGELGIKGELGISRAPFHQAAARVVADPADDRGSNTGGTDHRMGVLAEGLQHLFQPIQRATGKNQRLLGITQRQAGIEL